MKATKAIQKTEQAVEKKEAIIRLWLEQVPSPVTRRNYEVKIRKFIRTTGLDPFTITSFALDEYLKRGLEKKMNIGTLRGQLTVLNSLYRYVGTKKPDFISPVKGISVKLPDISDESVILTRKRALPKEMIEKVLRQFNDIENTTGDEPNGAFLFRFLLNTGLRISEALSLELFDEHKDNGDGRYINYVKVINGRGYVYVMGKGRRPREFFLSKDFTEYLLNHNLSAGEKIILNKHGRPLTSNGALYLMKYIERKYFKGYDVYKFTNHSLRHTYITMQVKNNESTINIAKTVGNSAAIIEKTYVSEAKDINEKFCFV